MFKDRLIDFRKKKHITQVGMAKLLRVSRQTYLDLESGKTEPRLSTLKALSLILDVDFSFLAIGEQGDLYQSFVIQIQGTKYKLKPITNKTLV